MSSLTCVGTATPMVSATAISSGEAAAARSASRITRSAGTSPSKGHPKAVEMVIWARMPASLASLAMSSQAARPSSTLQPWLRSLKLSLTAMAIPISVQPAAWARSKPLRLSTRPMKRGAGVNCASEASTASASAICGTRFGLTKLATSMRCRPAPSRRRMNSTLVAVGNTCDSLCRPSRGPTSTISMCSRLIFGFYPLGQESFALVIQTRGHDRHPTSTRRAVRPSSARARHAHRGSLLWSVARRHGRRSDQGRGAGPGRSHAPLGPAATRHAVGLVAGHRTQQEGHYARSSAVRGPEPFQRLGTEI